MRSRKGWKSEEEGHAWTGWNDGESFRWVVCLTNHGSNLPDRVSSP